MTKKIYQGADTLLQSPSPPVLPTPIPSLIWIVIVIFAVLGAVTVGTAAEGPGYPIFPADHIWNTRVDNLPVDPNSAAYISTIGTTLGLHPDFGSGTWEGFPIGIPYVSVPGTQPKVPVIFDWYGDESDPGPYPIPPGAPVEGDPEGDGDRHILVIDHENGMLYELYAAHYEPDGWHAGSGAIFDLNGYGLRPEGWTSADAAGLAIMPGLVRYDEVASGEINHAIRFTAPLTRKAYVWPARHYASSLTGSQYPPMGQRFRLKSDFDISGYPANVQVILTALKEYGMVLSDNGASWYLSGVPDERWDNDELHILHTVPGSAFEAVDVSGLMIDPGSGKARTMVPDTQPPGSVTRLTNSSYQMTAITWTWTDPADNDFAKVLVYLNGIFRAEVSKGTRTYTAGGLTAGTPYTLSTRTADTSGNVNASWVNHTALTAPRPAEPTLGAAVDNSILGWSTGGDAPWFAQTKKSYYDRDAAQSGKIANSGKTYLETTVTGPGTISFYWSVSSEKNHDFLTFLIDGAIKNRISGNQVWQRKTFSLGSGEHTLRWIYTKDYHRSSGSDAGWLDRVIYNQTG